MATPVKNTHASRCQTSEICRVSENFDPNLPISPPSQKPIKSPAIKSARSKKSAPQTPSRVVPPPPPAQERKFVVVKKHSRRGGKGFDFKKCRQEAYEALRASQEEFFHKDHATGATRVAEASPGGGQGLKDGVGNDGVEKDQKVGSPKNMNQSKGTGSPEVENLDVQVLEGSAKVRKMRSLVMEEAISSIPETGSGRVKHLVKAFESLLSISKEGEAVKSEDRKPRAMNWALPGLQQPTKTAETKVSSASVFSSAELFPSRDFERDSRLYSSMDSNSDRLSWGSRTSGGSRSRRNSSEFPGRSWNKKLRVTSQQPFKLRTEQRGRLKEEQFLKKVKELLVEEEKKRIPIAQGLPWTTDEPECLVKPPVKESTEPTDVVLHSDVRAVERAEFDHFVAERMNFAEQLRLERERQQKLEEEEEIRRLRKELVPKAQPMPYFDRPFIPKKSARPPTVPKEPRFHIHPVNSSW
ncbi:Protein TPX2 [Cocos nucifera]|uniref:Protein TPX2 n=1 Tax=Cocos nucifera TaxID=13894 RepID=A0A8K0ITF6_COCNU|nr:Protein TPX2 [Cocos nucifera]